jgi:hypothetical protein
MLTNAQVEAVIAVSGAGEATSLYGEKLGLEVLERIDVLLENPLVRMRSGTARSVGIQAENATCLLPAAIGS